jgi:hypothetical protein
VNKKMAQNNKELLVYSNRSEKTKTIKDKKEAQKILDARTKQTFLLKGILGLEINSADLMITFDAIETDDHLIKKFSFATAQTFFISQYVFRHLANFLGIPSAVYDLIMDTRRLSASDRIEVLEHLAEVLRIYFNHRIIEVENSRKKDIFMTVFTDIFGSYPRVIHSEIFYPYPDGEALTKLDTGVQTINEQNPDRQYTFRSAKISPYQSEFNYTNKLSRTQATRGTTIESGFTATNSECKKASYNFQSYVLRLECMNGATSRYTDNDLRVKHYEAGFESKITRAFVKALQLEDKFALKFIEATKYDQKISDDWADLLSIPSSILALNTPERKELIELGQEKYGEFTPANVLNTLTDKATHGSKDDSTHERYNEKAVILMNRIEQLDQWVPATQ